MKTIEKIGAQGDVLFMLATLPVDAKPLAPTDGKHVVAHSETGHHHWIQADGRVEMFSGPDPFTCYLRVAGFADVQHARPFDTHETMRLGEGTWCVRRQREYTPEGYRRVED